MNFAENENSSDVYVCIGESVVAAQVFESSFIMATRFAVKQGDAGSVAEVKQVSWSKAMKQPIRALLKEVAHSPKLDGMLGRLEKLIEDRNKLVHRLFQDFNWPQDNSLENRDEVMVFCKTVKTEFMEVTVMLCDLMDDWARKFPEFAGEVTKEG